MIMHTNKARFYATNATKNKFKLIFQACQYVRYVGTLFFVITRNSRSYVGSTGWCVTKWKQLVVTSELKFAKIDVVSCAGKVRRERESKYVCKESFLFWVVCEGVYVKLASCAIWFFNYKKVYFWKKLTLNSKLIFS